MPSGLLLLFYLIHQVLGTTHLGSLSHSPFLNVPPCILIPHLISVLDPGTLVHLGRVSKYFNDHCTIGINEMYKIESQHGLIWDIELVYDIHQSLIEDEAISGTLEQLIRTRIPKNFRDIRVDALIEHCYVRALFGKRKISRINHFSPQAAESI